MHVSVHIMPGEVDNPTITDHSLFVFEENPGEEITRMIIRTPSFSISSVRVFNVFAAHTKASVFNFLRFEESF